MRQPEFEFEKSGGVIPFEAPLPSKPERVRLSRQCQAILERLRLGNVTNDELAKIARKYTNRVSELRQAGYAIECYEHDYETGLTRYRLEEAQ